LLMVSMPASWAQGQEASPPPQPDNTTVPPQPAPVEPPVDYLPEQTPGKQ